MDITSPHFPYVMAAYVLTIGILSLLACWVVRADAKARRELAERDPDDA